MSYPAMLDLDPDDQTELGLLIVQGDLVRVRFDEYEWTPANGWEKVDPYR
jgi:hypothetical protein